MQKTRIFFWSQEKTLNNYNVFSQWYKSKFEDEQGVKYVNCEQYMMAQKAKLFEDENI